MSKNDTVIKSIFNRRLPGNDRGLAEITTILILLVFAVLISGVVIVFVTGFIPESTPPHNVVLDASIDSGSSSLILVHQTGDSLDVGACYITLFNENDVVQVGTVDTSGQGNLKAGYATAAMNISLNSGQQLQPMTKYLVKVYWSADDRQVALISTVAV